MVAIILAVAGGIAAATPASAANNWTLVNYPTLLDHPQKCLGIDASHKAGIWNCTWRNDQAWHLGSQINGSGYYQFINDHGKCLGVAGGSTAEGARVVDFRCEGPTHPDQYWTFYQTSPGDPIYWVFNYNSNYVLGVEGGRHDNGAPVVQWRWQQNPVNNQVWKKEPSLN
jgi:hypothetical protein